MPFEQGFEPIYEQLIKPALEDVGYEVARADTYLTQQNILRDVIAGIAGATLVVADLTTLNPNVMYELGIAHGLQVPTILITQSIEDLPFDLRSYRVVQYSDQFAEAPKLLNALNDLGSRRLEGRSAFGSPVLDFLGSRQLAGGDDAVTEPASHPKVTEEPEPEPDAPKGFLDFAVGTQDEMERMTALLNELNSATSTLGARLDKRAEEVGRAQDNVRLALAVSMHAAKDMTEYADQVDSIFPEYGELIDRLEDDLSSWVAHMSIASADDRESALSFREAISSQRPVIRQALESTAFFRQTVDEMPPASQATNTAKRRVLASLDKVIGSLEKHESLTARVVGLIDAQLAGADVGLG